MKCPSCGHENRAGAKFCGECGLTFAAGVACPQCSATNRAGQKFCDSCGGLLAATRSPTPPPSRALPSSLASGRYEVKSFLGEGGRKRVYLAHDTRLDRDVAIAVIKTEGLDADGLARVRREAEAMGRLGDHAHIVTIHDIGEDDDQPYIVSQYMAGGDLEGAIQQAENHRLPLDRALRIADQVCQALKHAHDRGIIHRDLKPGNIWLTDEGAAKLGDFGLAVALDRSRLTMAGTMVGTAAYMPPEQALGGEASYRSDLYSLGCVLYEMVTGRPPFLGEDVVAVISQHINTAPLGPSWLNPEVPRALDRYIRGLLAKDPDERPGSAAEVRAALAEIAESPPAGMTAELATAPGRLPVRGYRRSPFVGREKELGQLKDRLEDALSGRGSVVMVVGEPGIGKTRLSEELSVYARLRGAQVLLGQCYESEGAPPYIPFIEALRQYVNTRAADALREEMGDGASDLARLVSEVRARLPGLPQSPPQEPETERYRLLEAVSSFLVNASRANPLLLILDDIHWADKPSLLLLEHLARRLSDSRILLIGTYRDVELDRLHPLSEVLAQLRRERLYERVLLRGLDAEGVNALVSRRIEYEAVRAFTDVLHEQTDGNPFFTEEILFHLYETGAFGFQGGQYVGDLAALAENIPEGVREVIGRRLSRLSKTTNLALAFASVLGREFDFDVLEALSELEEEALLSALEEALRAQLVSEQKGAGGTSYRFSHALVQETLYGELSIARKQRLHLRAGRAIERARTGRLEPLVGQLAHHFHQGNDPEKAIDYSRQAGEAAIRVYAWEEAVRHWETALELMEEQGLGSEEERAQLLERLGDVTYRTGIDYEKGISSLEKALAIYERLGARGKAAAMHSRLGRGMVTFIGEHLDLENGAAHLEAARAALEGDAPDSPGLAYVYLALCTACTHTGDWQTGEAYSRRALEIGEKLNSRPVTANALVFVGYFLALNGKRKEGLELLERGWKIADEENLGFVAFVGATFGASQNLFGRQDPKAAFRWLNRELVKPRIASAPWLRLYLLGVAGQAHVFAGEMEEARQIRDAGNEFAPLLVRLEVASGDWERAEERWMRDVESVARTGVVSSAVGSAGELADLAFRRGQYDRAEDNLRFVQGILEEKGRPIPAWVHRSLARLFARAGRPEKGREEMDRCEASLAQGDDWGGTAGLVALARGAVATAEEKWNEAEAAFDEALAIAARYGLPWHEADALHERARMHLARGAKDDRKQALRLLDETIAIYQRLGARKHLELVLADKLQTQGVASTDIRTSIDAVLASVHAEQPDLRTHAAPDGTVTIMFSDIEGSTALTERLGDKRWMEVLREHNAIVRKALKAHGGFEVKSEGDGFMLAFQSARRALQCAIETQLAFAKRNEAAADPVRVRMGLHVGEVIKEGDDFFGKHVNLAARIAGQASGGEILVSSLLKELVGGAGDLTFAEGREVELKGLKGKHQVFEVVWRHQAGR